MQREYAGSNLIENVFFGDGNGWQVYHLLGSWADYNPIDTKKKLPDGTVVDWGVGFVITTHEEIAKTLGVARSSVTKILNRISKKKLILVDRRWTKKFTLIQLLKTDDFFTGNKREADSIQDDDSLDADGSQKECYIKNITIQQSKKLTNQEHKERTGGPGENSPSPVTAEAGDVSIFDPNDSNDLQTITRTEELQIVGGMDLDYEIKVPVKKRTRTKRPKTHVIAPEGGWPVSLYSAAEKLLQIAIFYYPHLQTSDTFTIDAFAHSLSKVCRSLGKESEFATLLATFIDDSDFWRRIACVPHSLLDKGKGGLRKIDHIYTQMSKKYASSLETIQRSKQFDFEAYRNDPSRSWLYEDPKPLDSK